jgi:DNA-binding PadR family transcriptional regulator
MSFEKRLEQIRFILNRLSRQPLRWTPLVKASIQVCGSAPRIYYILKFLEKKAFVTHENINGKLYWKITEKGRTLLAILSE